MAVRIWLVSGESVDVESETLREVGERLSAGGWVEYRQDGVVIAFDHVTHVEDPDRLEKQVLVKELGRRLEALATELGGVDPLMAQLREGGMSAEMEATLRDAFREER
jgi:hypothetical protein